MPRSGPALALLSAPIPVVGAFGRHTWLLVRDEGEAWERWELWQQADVGGESYSHVHRDLASPEHGVGAGGVRIEWALRGEQMVAMIACIRREAPRYEDREHYRVWPGPNSNTFTDAMLRRCDVPAPMTGTAVGKDWRGWLGASLTREQTGVQLESALFGVSLGLREGVEAHLGGLSLGIDLWPPALILPFGDGRYGFEN